MDLPGCVVKLDHSLGSPKPCTNWRQASGFPVFGVGQPTEEGLAQIAEKLSKGKIIWFNVRQEPVAYIGGLPVAPRNPEKPHINVEVSGKFEEVEVTSIRLSNLIPS